MANCVQFLMAVKPSRLQHRVPIAGGTISFHPVPILHSMDFDDTGWILLLPYVLAITNQIFLIPQGPKTELRE